MLKGGMLLTYSLGVQNRATQDIDFLVKGFSLESVEMRKVLAEIIEDGKQSDIWFELKGDAEDIRAEDEYGGLRFHIIGHLIRLSYVLMRLIVLGVHQVHGVIIEQLQSRWQIQQMAEIGQ